MQWQGLEPHSGSSMLGSRPQTFVAPASNDCESEVNSSCTKTAAVKQVVQQGMLSWHAASSPPFAGVGISSGGMDGGKVGSGAGDGAPCSPQQQLLLMGTEWHTH